LLDHAGWTGRRRYLAVDEHSRDLGAGELTPLGDTVVVLVGDGSARRSEKAPGHLDPRAEPFDAELGRCIRDGDIDGLAALDPALAAELMCAGITAWRWLAARLAARSVASAELMVESAPYGVGYFIGCWRF
jgi:hypothetical protein